jgi:hypothetical protein
VDPGLSFLPEGMREIRGNWLGFWGYQALFLLLLFLVLLMVALTPRRRLEAMKFTMLRRPGESFGVGLLMALVGHMVLLGLGAILVLTVIGIPVALLVLLVVIFLDLGAVGLSAMVVGQRLCERLGLGCGNPWREAFLGMALLHLPAFLAALLGPAGLPLFLIILISWIGRLVKFAAFCFGLGALVLGRLGASSQASNLTVPLDPTPDAHSA